MIRPVRGRIVKYAALIAFVFLVFVMQSTVFTHLRIFGAMPLLIPVASVCISLFEGSERGGVMGLICGILCDLSFNQPTIEFTLTLTIIGVGTGILCEQLLDRGFPSSLVCSACALVICAMVQMFPLLFYMKQPIAVLLETAIIQTAYSMIFVIPIYFVAGMINKIPIS